MKAKKICPSLLNSSKDDSSHDTYRYFIRVRYLSAIRCSSVCTATRYGLDGPGIEYR